MAGYAVLATALFFIPFLCTVFTKIRTVPLRVSFLNILLSMVVTDLLPWLQKNGLKQSLKPKLTSALV